ncbi:protein ZGRF1 isoform X10 [Histomonas meleagridis]|uniref:protein ZGRF1 isoform X10 n=1 Tax=Histomonas meleagridis TaxID=135588 RepID=UPI0035594073|nr:protein ZGRF1 isoform X10 [Histomonas meleagridis]
MQIKVTSIRLFNVQSEKLSISKLFSLDESSLPILPVLLNNNQQNVVTNDFLLNDKQIEEIRNIAEEISNEYHLNEYQKLSLMKVIDFFHPNTATPLLLIHGIFGAGKSKLLSIIIIFIDRILKLLHLDDQVLIASSTNVAVDNILNNLIEYEFEDFTRVGSVKKIKKNLLPYVTGHGNDEAISELHLIISETDNSERSVVQRALENAQNEYNQKKSKIDSVRVVGATCAATSFSVMSNKKFSFVILDECSQQTEPVSLLPISFGCKRLICAGDPLQLPPTLSKSAPNGYGRPLFSRVSKRFPPVMLQTQYRCHPSIADICSCLFYKGMVKNGVTEDDRRPVLETLPTMCLFDVKCGAEQYRGGSICNAAEAITVVNLVKYLVDAGISARDIGVIAFYKAQVELICEGLTVDGQRKRTIVDVSTVDAFQGDEREVVIITTAKTKKTAFVDSPERVNVAVSRARRHLFVVSNVRPLIESELWNTLFARACRAPNKESRSRTRRTRAGGRSEERESETRRTLRVDVIKNISVAMFKFAVHKVSYNPIDANAVKTEATAIKEDFCKNSPDLTQDELYAHPVGVEQLYGDKELISNAKRYKVRYIFNPNYAEQHTTALYVPPGELITIELPEKHANGVSITVNNHAENVDDVTRTPRYPILGCTTKISITGRVTKFGWPLGGNLVFSFGIDKYTNNFEVNISGVILSPYFRYGSTTDEEWEDTIRQYPGPYTFLDTGAVHIQLPSSTIRSATQLNDAMAFLRGVSVITYSGGEIAYNDRRSDGRVQNPNYWYLDSYVRVGEAYAVQGANIVRAPNYWSGSIVNYNSQRQGCWGTIHEYGHHFQDWGFERYGEASNNIYAIITYSLYTPISSTRTPNGDGTMSATSNDGWSYVTHQNGILNYEGGNVVLTLYANLMYAFGQEKTLEIIHADRYNTYYYHSDGDSTTLTRPARYFMTACKVLQRNLIPYF